MAQGKEKASMGPVNYRKTFWWKIRSIFHYWPLRPQNTTLQQGCFFRNAEANRTFSVCFLCVCAWRLLFPLPFQIHTYVKHQKYKLVCSWLLDSRWLGESYVGLQSEQRCDSKWCWIQSYPEVENTSYKSALCSRCALSQRGRWGRVFRSLFRTSKTTKEKLWGGKWLLEAVLSGCAFMPRLSLPFSSPATLAPPHEWRDLI